MAIPVWYEVAEDGSVDYDRVIVPDRSQLPVDPSAQSPSGYDEDQRGKPGGFVGDPDVFDTWATSSLTPLILTGWPDDMDGYARLYPTDLRPQSHEIIRTWAFSTITRSYLEDGSIPWSNVAISGWILDPDRKKMSKSKGNVVLPTDLLDEFGSDAARYWAGSARLGVDTAFDRNVLKEGRRLVTKIRNAARLVLGYEGQAEPATNPLDIALLARLREVVARATREWDEWNHAGALAVTETWFWSDLCDNYLELSKTRAYAGDPSAIGTLRTALDVVLRLFAPFLPYVTEEVWNSGPRQGSSVHAATWPQPEELPPASDECFSAAVALVTAVRRAKSEGKVSPKFPVERVVVRGPQAMLDALSTVLDDVTATLTISTVELAPDEGSGELVADVTLAPAP